MLERLRAFYDADLCFSILPDKQGEYHLRQIRRVSAPGQRSGAWRARERAQAPGAEPRAHVERLPGDVGQTLMALPAGAAIAYNQGCRTWRHWTPRFQWVDFFQDPAQQQDPGRVPDEATIAPLLALFQTEAFGGGGGRALSLLSVPVRYHGETIGRLYVLSRQGRVFTLSDADFILQGLEQIAPVLDNILLVESLAPDAAHQERQRMAHDIHDSVIQPYLAMEIALSAITQKHADAAPNGYERLGARIEDDSGRCGRFEELHARAAGRR